MALVQYNLGYYTEALVLYTERLASIWKFYGAVHPSIADTLIQIASVHDKQGRYLIILHILALLLTLCIFGV